MEVGTKEKNDQDKLNSTWARVLQRINLQETVYEKVDMVICEYDLFIEPCPKKMGWRGQ